MTEIEPVIFDVGSNLSTNCAETTAHDILQLLARPCTATIFYLDPKNRQNDNVLVHSKMTLITLSIISILVKIIITKYLH